MRTKTLLAGAVAGVALGLGGVVAADVASEPADAQGGGQVTQADLKAANERSQSAIRRATNLQNALGKYFTPDGVRIGTRQPPGVIRQDAGTGQNGLPTGTILNGAITNPKLGNESVDSQKIAPGGVTSGDLADGAATGEKIADGAVGASELSSGLSGRIPRWAAVDSRNNTTVTVFFAQNGATAVSPTGLEGRSDVTFDVPATAQNCAAFVTTEGGLNNESARVTFNGGNVRVFTYNAMTGVLIGRDYFVSLYCNA